ncbi:MAG: hypothetical protein LRY43_01395 [Gammaproteobacteria bacterium]|nr:hypothetical protein [Gammaproteobacteria bacterium]
MQKFFLCICSFQRKTTSHQGRTKIEAEQLASEEMLNILSNNHIHSSEDKKNQRDWPRNRHEYRCNQRNTSDRFAI